MKTLNWLGLFGVLSAYVVHADDIEIKGLRYAGTGCGVGSVAAQISPDQKELSVLFSEYQLEAGGRKRVDRKNCSLVIPVEIPGGISVTVIGVSFRGYNYLPRGADSLLSAEYFFADDITGAKAYHPFYGEEDSDYLETDTLAAVSRVWSGCGARTNLRVNSNMRLKTNSRGDQAISTLDSIDINAGIVFHLALRPCRK